jgi:hypothetical protein
MTLIEVLLEQERYADWLVHELNITYAEKRRE